MPRISWFYGITIAMFYREHGVPHLHATYNGETAVIAIADPKLLAGALPPRAAGFVIEWVSLHRGELMRNWERERSGQRLEPVPPLP